MALVPAMAAREVVVSALGTVYALSATGDEAAAQLGPLIAQQWSLATALSLLVWFVFAPQCIATLATVRRETNFIDATRYRATDLAGQCRAADGQMVGAPHAAQRVVDLVGQPGRHTSTRSSSSSTAKSTRKLAQQAPQVVQADISAGPAAGTP
jgi:hypothetical protein